MESIRELLIDEMKDLYDAEKQLVKALPKVIKAAANAELRAAVESHLEQTRGHVQRLERAFELLGEKPKSKPCAAMQGLIEEAGEVTKEDMTENLTDSAIICAAQKVEHYEIAGYGTIIAWAKALGLDEVAELLDQTLEEEKAANDKLTDVASEILEDAAAAESDAAENEQDNEAETVGTGVVPRKGASNKTGGNGSRKAG
jgi:ferritin-like metal-binding protein YciE